VEIEGVTLRDSASWNLVLNKTQGAQISNIKEFGWRLNSDGIDVNSSSNVTISDSFLRTYDDLVAIKTNDTASAPIPSTDITVQHMVLWNEKAHALTVGYEIMAPAHNILFTDCDIIRDTGHDFLLAIDNADGAAVQGVTFQNINVEQVNGLMEVAFVWTPASADPVPGEIDSITFSNIRSAIPQRAAAPYAHLVGYDPVHQIDGVTFNDVMVGGEPLQAGEVVRSSTVPQTNSIQKVAINQ
jgi:polygalacturonase